ncbi:unnamed protein product [Hermetia illucens]|uniref:Alanyl-transfer RNA synthetases family profile domain-containing protein n=1 Tax=Hermetia illucens TaxID=343691 RepID=A0A7R8YZ92_HERIL|nr:alanyl-tRNA editing protein Aarsd1-B [Hermetia illucens]XP_037919531.1 alanyl-tRNA editing protein Aarsd1-B [Hermetia illucens]CAD7090231.1 unnamed protein product [Hermetia illucens]
MVFKCQEDSFLKEFVGKVVSCEPVKTAEDSKETEYKVILDDTILFPEGGGQPFDYGTLDGKPVKSVIRVGSEAVHFVEMTEPFQIGQKVKQIVDWPRRMDHMQQHSGQHLITALFSREFGFETQSWWLGNETSYIDLAVKDVTKENMDRIERIANELIFEGRAVTVEVTTVEKGLQFQDIRAPRGLPADHVGPVRVVNIEGVESNMCCGTHVRNLSQLQAIKLLHAEKTKGKVLVHFLVGNRVIKKLGECYGREMQMNNILRGGPSSHIDLIEKLQSNQKSKQKAFLQLLKDFAVAEASKLRSLESKPKFFSLHRRDGIEPDFISTFLRNAPDDIFYFMTVGDTTGKGHMVLKGDEEIIKKISAEFLELLDGKGNGKGKSFQAKVNNLAKINECEKMLIDALSGPQPA